MADNEKSSNSNIGCGCSTPVSVLTIGLGLTIFGAAIGGGCSVRIPLTEASISAAGSVGSNQASRDALPDYLNAKVASNRDFINSTHTLNIGPAEGTGLFVVGEQPGSPLIDLYLAIETKDGKFHLVLPNLFAYKPREVKN